MHADFDRRYTAGDWIDDRCRPCGMARRHTVIVAAEGTPVRVLCDTCGSQHNYRGAGGDQAAPRPSAAATPPQGDPGGDGGSELESLLRRVIREEAGFTPCRPAEKWLGGELVLRPGREGLQEKSMPIDSFFNKIVMVRNRLRSLEQQVNASELPADVKAKLQSYLTGCYGSLTTFNVLFAEESDRIRGR